MEINSFLDYTEQYEDMFDISSSVEMVGKYKIADFECVVDFNDTNFNIEGYYIIKKYTKQELESETSAITVVVEPNFYIELYMKPNKQVNSLNYLNKIKELISQPVELFSVKNYYYTDNNVRVAVPAKCECEIYGGSKISLAQGKSLYMFELFHPEISEITEEIMSLSNKQFEQMGILLHGPPGTGKSRFAFLTALMTERHIVEIDLATFEKHEVYEILQRPCIQGKNLKSEDVVFVFDEFDVTVINLFDNEECEKRELDQSLEFILREATHNKEGIDLDQKRFSNEVTISSLLEIIQGPVPLERAIFIATTNNIEEIEKLCPALCRPGRLTPIHFGYAETVTLQQISEFHYQEELDIPENMIATISTAEIIENTTKYKFDQFEQFVRQHIKPDI